MTKAMDGYDAAQDIGLRDALKNVSQLLIIGFLF
jgi:hypothetical protein